MKKYRINFFKFIAWMILSGFVYNTSADTLQVPSATYPTIQSAIDAAQENDVVIVSIGNYVENINFFGKAITVRSTDSNDPNTVAQTIIDGSNPADPNHASTVTFNSGEGNDSILEGFTITGGTGTWLAISWDFHEIYWNRCGGGIVCYNLSAPTIRKNRIVNNLAGEGGGLFVYGDPVNSFPPVNPPIHITPVITGNLFENNTAIMDHGYTPPDDIYTLHNHGDGGAIVCFQGVDAVITENTIKNNHADYYGGGLHLRQWSNGILENNRIESNDSALGAGVHITYNSAPTVRKNKIVANSAGGLGGGGIYIYYLSTPLIEQNKIWNNSSSNGAGIGVYYQSSPIIKTNMIFDNELGAGIIVKGSSNPFIHNNTIVSNEGGGIYIYGNTPCKIENNIIASNGNAYGIFAFAPPPQIHYNNVWDHPSGNYNSIIGDQTNIDGNISKDPRFISEQDFHLLYSSPCINAADPNYLPNGSSDIDQQPRLLGEFLDIGADEALPVWNLNENSQYLTIQQAINNANELDVIVLTQGRHTGDGNRDIDFLGKAITLQSSNPLDPDITENTIIDCQGSLSEPHRGFYFHNNETIDSVINGLTITGGSGAYEGGGIKCVSSSPTIQNCIIRNNKSKDHGGGICCRDASSPVISNCLITENTFDVYGYGAGIYCTNGSSPLILNCVITKNFVLGNSPPGQGRHGGGICCWAYGESSPSNAIIANCLISGNIAEHRGGGVYAYWSSPTVVNCTIIGNVAYEGGGVGSFREANPKVYNSIVRDNIAEIGNQLALISTIRVWSWEEITEMTVANSNIKGAFSDEDVWVDTNMILHWEPGNITADPNFVDAGFWDNAGTASDPDDDFFVIGNYHLNPNSPCADSGDNTLVPAGSTNDFDDEQRIFNDIVDIGADEIYHSPADYNTSGRVNIEDLAILIENWLDPENMNEFRQLSDNWLWQGKWLE